MIFGRVLSPCSKRALADEAQGTLLAAACGLDQGSETFDEDDLYAAMDALNGRWVPLEQALYGQAFPASVSLVLYDLTSVYFEGKGPAGLSDDGYSRDHRPDRPQVLRQVRPRCARRELFLTLKASFRTLSAGGLYHVVSSRL